RLPMVPADRALSPPPAEHRVGAVLALFYPDGDDLKVILLRRPSTMRNHAGQITFPGGKQDEGETLEQTALRETWEEIGIPAEQVTVVGRIDPLYIPPSNFYVHCFVAWIDREPECVPSEAEVSEIYKVSWTHFLGEANRGRDDIDVGIGRKISVPFFTLNEHRIWGATSTMLAELAHRIDLVRSANS
ncbi:MAG: CoA pyrophosphatase, partial [Chloroflexota bacterium]